jgi:hypothetical protein
MSANNDSNFDTAVVNAESAQIKYPIFYNDYAFIEKKRFEREFLKTKKSTEIDKKIVNASVYCLNLHKILVKSPKDQKIIEVRKEIRKNLSINRVHDLLHSIVGLYDQALPDIGAEYIYDCVCSRKANTIFVYKDLEDEEAIEKGAYANLYYKYILQSFYNTQVFRVHALTVIFKKLRKKKNTIFFHIDR